MSEQDSPQTTDEPKGWVRALNSLYLAVVAIFGVLALLFIMLASYLSWVLEKEEEDGAAPTPVFTGTMDDTPLPEARAQTINLLLEIYQALGEQAGVGEWKPKEYWYQAREVPMICSDSEAGANEEYDLAEAGEAISREDAISAVEQLAAPHGFVRIDDQSNGFIRPSDEATIIVAGGENIAITTVSITTGCHRGEVFQDWPAGTENIPAHLRGAGRQRQPGLETWPAQEPATPIPSPPPNWTTPAPSRTPE